MTSRPTSSLRRTAPSAVRNAVDPISEILRVRVKKVFLDEVLVVDWAEAPAFNLSLRRAIARAERDEPSYDRSNSGGWHSNTDLLDRRGSFAILGKRVRYVLGHQVRSGPAAKVHVDWSVCGWANILRSGNYHRAHTHGEACWSGVYYVSVPPGGGGHLRFHDRNPREKRAKSLIFEPREGLMLVFPGHLWHSVDEWQADRPRISVSFNAW